MASLNETDRGADHGREVNETWNSPEFLMTVVENGGINSLGSPGRREVIEFIRMKYEQRLQALQTRFDCLSLIEGNDLAAVSILKLSFTRIRESVLAALTSYSIFAPALLCGDQEPFVQISMSLMNAGIEIESRYQNYNTPIQIKLLGAMVDIFQCLLELWFIRACEEGIAPERKTNGADKLHDQLVKLEDNLSELGRRLLEPTTSVVHFAKDCKKQCYQVIALQMSVRHMKLQLHLGLQEITKNTDQDHNNNIRFVEDFRCDARNLPSTESLDRLISYKEELEKLAPEQCFELLQGWHPSHHFHFSKEKVVIQETALACSWQIERTIDCRRGAPWCNHGGTPTDPCSQKVLLSQILADLGFPHEETRTKFSAMNRAAFTELLEVAITEACDSYSTCATFFQLPTAIPYRVTGTPARSEDLDNDFVVFSRLTEDPCGCHKNKTFNLFSTPKVRVFHRHSSFSHKDTDAFTLVAEGKEVLSILPPGSDNINDRIGYIARAGEKSIQLAFAGFGMRGWSKNYICPHYSVFLSRTFTA